MPVNPAVIAAGASLLGTGVNAIAQGNLNKGNRKWQEQMWHATNEYNKPLNQMARFKEAGLNPHLIYGQGNSGPASMAAAPKQEAPNYNFADAALSYVAVRKQQSEIDNLKKAEEVMEADRVQKLAATQNLLSQSAKTTQETQQASELFQTVKSQAEANLDMTNSLMDKVSMEIKSIGVQNRLSEIQMQNIQQQMQESKARIKNMQMDNNFKGIQIEIESIKRNMWQNGINPNDNATQQLLKRFIDAILPIKGTSTEAKGALNLDIGTFLREWWMKGENPL